jgi:hypothetical protein
MTRDEAIASQPNPVRQILEALSAAGIACDLQSWRTCAGIDDRAGLRSTGTTHLFGKVDGTIDWDVRVPVDPTRGWRKLRDARPSTSRAIGPFQVRLADKEASHSLARDSFWFDPDRGPYGTWFYAPLSVTAGPDDEWRPLQKEES